MIEALIAPEPGTVTEFSEDNIQKYIDYQMTIINLPGVLAVFVFCVAKRMLQPCALTQTLDQTLHPKMPCARTQTLDQALNPKMPCARTQTLDQALNPNMPCARTQTLDQALNPNMPFALKGLLRAASRMRLITSQYGCLPLMIRNARAR